MYRYIHTINIFCASWGIIYSKNSVMSTIISLYIEKLSSSPHYEMIANTFLTHNCIWKMSSIQWLSLGGDL